MTTSVDGSTGILTNLVSSSGNVTGGNVLTAGAVSATGNITSGNITTAGLISATGNITSGNITTAGIMSSAGNAIHGNITTAGLISATGNITSGNIVTAGTISSTGNVITAGSLVTATKGVLPASMPAGSIIQTKWTDLGAGSWVATTNVLTNTGFSSTFTPQFSTSKVLHIVTIGCNFVCDGQLKIARNGTVVSPSLMDSYRDMSASYVYDMPLYTFSWIDSPTTTSAITYALFACATGCGQSAYVGGTGDATCSWLCMEIVV